MEKILKDFLLHISDNYTDRYGHLEIVFSNDEATKQDYYSSTPDYIIEQYLRDKKLLGELK